MLNSIVFFDVSLEFCSDNIDMDNKKPILYVRVYSMRERDVNFFFQFFGEKKKNTEIILFYLFSVMKITTKATECVAIFKKVK